MTNTPFSVSVYGKPNCPFCDRAKQLLDEHNVPYMYYDVSDESHLARLKELHPSVNTVPQVFMLDTNEDEIYHIGGYEDLAFVIERTYHESEARENDA